MKTPPAKELAKLLARYGRNGDTELVHMTKGEVHALNLLSGLASDGLTINPDTGLPEAFDLKWLIPIAAIAAIALTGGAAAAPIASTAASTAAPAAGAALGTAATTTAAADAAAVAAADAAAGLGGSAAYNATLGGIANTGQTALAQSAGLAGTPMAGQSINQAVQGAELLNKTNPYIANTFTPPPAENPSMLSQIGNFAKENPMMALMGMNALGSAFTPEAEAPKEDSDPNPKNEWRPGEGNVPFQQKGVRQYVDAPISDVGIEATRIGYGPSVDQDQLTSQLERLRTAAVGPGFKEGPFDDLRLKRRFADGGTVDDKPKYKTDLSMLFGGVAPMIADGFTNGNKFGSGILGAMFNERKPWEREVKQMAAGGIAQGMPAGPAPIPMPPMANPAPLGVPRNAPLPSGGLGNAMAPPQPSPAMPPQGGPAQGGELSPADQQLVMATAAALAGKIPNPEPVIKAFVAKFGPEALAELAQAVKGAAKQGPAIPPNMGRLLSGPGGGVDDMIPSSIDGKQPAALSSGEFVVPAAAVSGLGDGSTEHGARKLQKMVNKVNTSKYGRRDNPEPIDDDEVMPI